MSMHISIFMRNARILLALVLVIKRPLFDKCSTVEPVYTLARVFNLLVSLGHPGRRVILGHTLNTQILMKTDEQKKKRF